MSSSWQYVQQMIRPFALLMGVIPSNTASIQEKGWLHCSFLGLWVCEAHRSWPNLILVCFADLHKMKGQCSCHAAAALLSGQNLRVLKTVEVPSRVRLLAWVKDNTVSTLA